jgi:hypothetical protein
VGFFLLAVYLLMNFSRTIEILLPSVRLTAVLYALALAFAIITGGLQRAFSNRVGIFLGAFCLWLVIATPFSLWRGGSVATLINAARTLPVYLLIAGLARDAIDTRKIINVIAFGTFLLSIYTFFVGKMNSGRLELEYGKFANPNDLAIVLLIGLPFWWLSAADPALDKVRRIGAGMAGIISLAVMTRTGSRAALFAAAVTLAVFFLKSSNRGRLMMAAGAVVFIAIAAGTMPRELRIRYFTFFEADNTERMNAEEQARVEQAIGSAYARAHLLEASIALTLANPIFGVGPGMFQVGESNLAEASGARPSWHESHNSYTQVSSEAGLPAFFFFTSVLVLSLKVCLRVYRNFHASRQTWALANMAFAVLLSLISFGVAAIFVSSAYDVYLPALAGLATCVGRAGAAAERRQMAAGTLGPQPAAAPVPRLGTERPAPRRRRLVSP